MNYQCMPLDPQYGKTYGGNGGTGSWAGTWMTGVEYQTAMYGSYPKAAHNQNAPCARCYTNNRPAVMMIPAKKDCPDSWTKEYEGTLCILVLSPSYLKNIFIQIRARLESTKNWQIMWYILLTNGFFFILITITHRHS